MEHKLLKDIFLLSLHVSKKKKVYVTNSMMNYSLVGAILYEMLAENSITFIQKKVVLNAEANNIDPLFIPFYKTIQKARNKRIKMLTSRMINHTYSLRKVLFEDLEKRGIVVRTRHRFLWVFPYTSRYMTNTTSRDSLVNDLKSVLFSNKKLDFYEASLLSLIKASKLEKVLTKDKQELKAIKKQIESKVEASEISKDIQLAFNEMQAALTIIMISSAVAASSSR
jgi:hypothetical protein